MKSVLIIIPYDNIYPPMNGGMQRCFHILHQLALHFNVTAIIHQDKISFEKACMSFPALAKVDLYSTKDHGHAWDIFSLLPRKTGNAFRYRWYKRALTGITDSHFLTYYPVLKKILKKTQFDAVILENLATLNAVDLIRSYNKGAFIIYDTHNVGTLMVEVDVAKGIMDTHNAEVVKKFENTLSDTVDAILACSVQDLDAFERLNAKPLSGVVIANGVHLYDTMLNEGVSLEEPLYIIFCGSLGYEPNSEGLSWFYRQIWPAVLKQIPALRLIVLGSGKLPAELAYMESDHSLLFTGSVDDVKPWYSKASIAIVPLKSGSGTRLKIIEAMGLGVPVISTTKGAEGIDYKQGSDIIIADNEMDFVAELCSLACDKEKRNALQSRARALVEKEYDWNVIGTELQEFIHATTGKKVA